jgi:ABC-type lipoprotein export system ATPase subunit
MTALDVCGAVKEFDTGEGVRAVDGVSMHVASGEAVLLAGPSGSGKSTLLRLAAGLELADEGSVRVGGRDLSELSARERGLMLRCEIGWIPQRDSLVPELTALSNAALRLRVAGIARREARERAASWLDRLGLTHRVDHYPSQLSGGERQRVAIARALVSKPRLVLADEPTSHLDRHRGDEIVRVLVASAHDQGAAVLIVSHDERIEQVVDRVERIEDGRLMPNPLLQSMHTARG